MSEKRPFIVTFIADGCIISAFILLLIALFPKLVERIGVYSAPLPNYLKIPFLSEDIMKVLISIIFLITAFGFLRLKRWSYWLMVSINIYLLAGWAISYHQSKLQSAYINPISVIIGLIFIIPTIKYFSKSTTES